MDIESYSVQEDDTIFSISLKFDMPVYNLLRRNKLSEDSILYPGMTLKIKKGVKKNVKIDETEIINLNRHSVIYCCREGDIKGILSYNDSALLFTPNTVNSTNCLIRTSSGIQEKDSLEFHQCLDLKDILSASLVEYPGYDSDNLQQTQLYLKLIISRTGYDENTTNNSSGKGAMYFHVINI